MSVRYGPSWRGSPRPMSSATIDTLGGASEASLFGALIEMEIPTAFVVGQTSGDVVLCDAKQVVEAQRSDPHGPVGARGHELPPVRAELHRAHQMEVSRDQLLCAGRGREQSNRAVLARHRDRAPRVPAQRRSVGWIAAIGLMA